MKFIRLRYYIEYLIFNKIKEIVTYKRYSRNWREIKSRLFERILLLIGKRIWKWKLIMFYTDIFSSQTWEINIISRVCQLSDTFSSYFRKFNSLSYNLTSLFFHRCLKLFLLTRNGVAIQNVAINFTEIDRRFFFDVYLSSINYERTIVEETIRARGKNESLHADIFALRSLGDNVTFSASSAAGEMRRVHSQ